MDPNMCEMCNEPCIVLVNILLNTGDPIPMFVCTGCLDDLNTGARLDRDEQAMLKQPA